MSLFVRQGRAFALAAMLAIGAAGTAAGETETVFDVNDAKNGTSHGAEFWGYTYKNAGTAGQLATVTTTPAEGDGFAAAFYNGGGNVKFDISDTQRPNGQDAGAGAMLYWADEPRKPYNKDISEWKGVFITYSLTLTTVNTIYLRLSTAQVPEGGDVMDGETLTEYNEHKLSLPTSTQIVRRYFPFSQLKDESGWGKRITLDQALKNSHGFNIELGTNGKVDLTVTKVELSPDVNIYTITTSAGSGGALSYSASVPVVGGGILEGDSVVFTATPNSGRVVLGWMVDGVSVEGYTAKTLTLRNISKATKVEVYFKEGVDAIASADRVIPVAPANGVTSVAPVNRITAEFSAGPTPAVRSSGSVSFFRQGVRVSSSTLTVYDASGNAVRKVAVRDDAPAAWKRRIGSWDLKDANGRAVPEGTYLARGVLKTADGKSERVSAVVGVR